VAAAAQAAAAAAAMALETCHTESSHWLSTTDYGDGQPAVAVDLTILLRLSISFGHDSSSSSKQLQPQAGWPLSSSDQTLCTRVRLSLLTTKVAVAATASATTPRSS
jgi:hypothetical protein